jgi:hypothetical protein
MNNYLIIALFVSICLNIYSTPFLKLSFTKITDIYKKIKMNEQVIFQIEEPNNTMYLHVYGNDVTSTNYTIPSLCGNKHHGYDFAMLVI